MMNESRAQSHSVSLINIQQHIWAVIDVAGDKQQGAMLSLSECMVEETERKRYILIFVLMFGL